jgi:hypothetical protein
MKTAEEIFLMKKLLLIPILSLAMLCGCNKHEEIKAVKHISPQRDCELLCSEDKYYSILVEGKYVFVENPVYTNRQDAIERSWTSYHPNKIHEAQDSLLNHTWLTDCK